MISRHFEAISRTTTHHIHRQETALTPPGLVLQNKRHPYFPVSLFLIVDLRFILAQDTSLTPSSTLTTT